MPHLADYYRKNNKTTHNWNSLLPGKVRELRAAGKIARVTNYYNLQDWLAQVR